MKTECACAKCVHACSVTPGWFMPGEAEMAAQTLGIPFIEFEKNLIKDHASNPYVNDAPYVYSPRKVGVDGEESIRTTRTQRERGPCVFLKENRCSIHSVKPFECSTIKACNYQHDGIRDQIETKWVEAGAPLGMRPEVDDNDN